FERIREAVDVRLRQAERTIAQRRTEGRRAALLELGVDEEERAVANDRTTQREAVLVLLEVADVVLAAHEVLVASVAVDRAEEIVLAALRHGVDEDAGEVALAHVVRRQQYLVL